MSAESPKRREKTNTPKKPRGTRSALFAALAAYGLVTTEPAESKWHPPSTPIPTNQPSTAEELDRIERRQVEQMMEHREAQIRKDADEFITVTNKFEHLLIEAEGHLTAVTGLHNLDTVDKETLLAAREKILQAASQGNPTEKALVYDAFLDFKHATAYLAEFVQLHGGDKSAVELLTEFPVLIDPLGNFQNVKEAQQNHNFFTYLKKLVGTQKQNADLLVQDIPGSIPKDRILAALSLVIIAEHIDLLDAKPRTEQQNPTSPPDTKSINATEEGEPT